jgi:uncharacterized membrane protein SirB2
LRSLSGSIAFRDAWLTAKLLALIAYIGAGHVALRRAQRAR